jgi:hypothetical protein
LSFFMVQSVTSFIRAMIGERAKMSAVAIGCVVARQQLQVALLGTRLTEDDANALEVAVANNPADVDSRLKLLGYYMMPQLTNRALRNKRAPHVLWFVENHPDSEIVGSPFCTVDNRDPSFQTVSDAWERALECGRPEVILHAADFYRQSDPVRCRLLLERGEREVPSWPIWALQLGTDHFRAVEVARMFEARGDQTKPTEAELKSLAREALVHFERALALAPTVGWRFQILPKCMEAAEACGQLADAATYAEATIAISAECPDERHRPDYLHDAHIVRGHVALGSGDVTGACREIEAAGAQGSANAPVLRSFGPDFRLAGRLLEAHETKAVLAYLDQCATFWNPKRIAKWRAEIEQGGRPAMFTGYDPSECSS